MSTKKTETNVEEVIVKANELVRLQSVNGPNTTTALGYYNNKILNVVGTLDQILRINSDFGSYMLVARPSNVIGCTAQLRGTQGWSGFLGAFATTDDFDLAVPDASNVEPGAAYVIVDGVILSAKEVP